MLTVNQIVMDARVRRISDDHEFTIAAIDLEREDGSLSGIVSLQDSKGFQHILDVCDILRGFAPVDGCDSEFEEVENAADFAEDDYEDEEDSDFDEDDYEDEEDSDFDEDDDEESTIHATLRPKTMKATIQPKASEAKATLAPKASEVRAHMQEVGSAVALPTEKTELQRDSKGNICW